MESFVEFLPLSLTDCPTRSSEGSVYSGESKTGEATEGGAS